MILLAGPSPGRSRVSTGSLKAALSAGRSRASTQETQLEAEVAELTTALGEAQSRGEVPATIEDCLLIDGAGSTQRRNTGGLPEASSVVNSSCGVRSLSTRRSWLFSSFSTASRCSSGWIPRSVLLGK